VASGELRKCHVKKRERLDQARSGGVELTAGFRKVTKGSASKQETGSLGRGGARGQSYGKRNGETEAPELRVRKEAGHTIRIREPGKDVPHGIKKKH